MRPTPPTATLHSVADPTRRALFERLARHGPLTVRDLTAHSGVSQPAVSKHLTVLRNADLVQARHHGRHTYYTARPQGLTPLINWLNLHRHLLNRSHRASLKPARKKT